MKTTADPDLAREHLAANPDIPVVVPQELAGLDGEPGVIVDPDLSHGNVADSVDRTLQGVGALDGVAAHEPWITLAVSSFREIVLCRARGCRRGSRAGCPGGRRPGQAGLAGAVRSLQEARERLAVELRKPGRAAS